MGCGITPPPPSYWPRGPAPGSWKRPGPRSRRSSRTSRSKTGSAYPGSARTPSRRRTGGTAPSCRFWPWILPSFQCNDAPGTVLVPIQGFRYRLRIAPSVYYDNGYPPESHLRQGETREMPKKRLGELLLETGLLDEQGLARALGEQRSKRGKLGDVVLGLGLATEQEICQALSLQLGIPTIDLKNTPVEPQAIEL